MRLTPEEGVIPSNDPEAARRRAAKERQAWRRSERRRMVVSRFFRFLYAFLSVVFVIYAFPASMVLISTYRWSTGGAGFYSGMDPTNSSSNVFESLLASSGARSTGLITSRPYNLLSPWVNGNCTCFDALQSYCAESSDVFQGATYLSVAVVACDALIVVILLYELSLYGVFGGSHEITRLTLLLGLASMATKMLSLASFYVAWGLRWCGLESFQDLGFKLGWTYYYRAAESLLAFLLVVLILKTFTSSVRGPPSTALFFITIILGLSAFSLYAHGWMIGGNGNQVLYSTWESCICTPLCTSVKPFMTSAFSLVCVQAFLAFLGCFSVALRAVDNEGITPKQTLVVSVLGFIFSATASALYLSQTWNGTLCGSQIRYGFAEGIKVQLSVAGAFLLSILFNAIYLKSVEVEEKYKGISVLSVSQQDGAGGDVGPFPVAPVSRGSPRSGAEGTTGSAASRLSPLTGSVNIISVSLFHTWWWFELRDPRTLSLERREIEDSEAEESNSEDEDREKMSPGGTFTAGGLGVSQKSDNTTTPRTAPQEDNPNVGSTANRSSGSRGRPAWVDPGEEPSGERRENDVAPAAAYPVAEAEPEEGRKESGARLRRKRTETTDETMLLEG